LNPLVNTFLYSFVAKIGNCLIAFGKLRSKLSVNDLIVIKSIENSGLGDQLSN